MYSHVVLVAIVTWAENCSTTLHEKFLHVNLSSTFHKKNLAKAESCSCSSSGWKSLTHQKTWSLWWAKFFFVVVEIFLSRVETEKFWCCSSVSAWVLLQRNLSSNQRVRRNIYYFNIVSKFWVEIYGEKNLLRKKGSSPDEKWSWLLDRKILL